MYLIKRLEESEFGWYLFRNGIQVQASVFDHGIPVLSDAIEASQQVIQEIRALEKIFEIES